MIFFNRGIYNFNAGIFIDLSKACDTVDHNIFFDKCFHHGIRAVAHNWLSITATGILSKAVNTRCLNSLKHFFVILTLLK